MQQSYGGIIRCPKCGGEIAERNQNPLRDLAYCDVCKVNYSYRELMEANAEAGADEEPSIPSNAVYTIVVNPDGTETVKRKFTGSLIWCILFLIGCGAVVWMALRGIFPIHWALGGVGIALCAIVVTFHRYNHFTMDAGRRCLLVRHGFKVANIDYDRIVEIDVVQIFSDKLDSFEARAVLESGEAVEIMDGLKRDDVLYLRYLIERRCFAK